MASQVMVTPTTSIGTEENVAIEPLNKTLRLDDNTYRNYKWHDWNSESIAYAEIINFKRSSNPRGSAHHCVMCGDKNAAIPSQNKDVCKTCDTGFWLVKATQIVVKFCKGCKNFARLWDFRDKPEATKCIKCRQRGRLNYFSKKSGGGEEVFLEQAFPPSTMSDFDAQTSSVVTAGDSFSFKGSSSRPRINSAIDDKFNALGTFGSYKTTGDFIVSSSGRPTRARSATLGSTDLRRLPNDTNLGGEVELKDAASMLMAASKVFNYTSETSPRAALLSAAMGDMGNNSFYQPPFFSKGSGIGVWSNLSTQDLLVDSVKTTANKKAAAGGGADKSNPLLQLAELSEHIMDAEHILHIGGNGLGERRQRSNTLDLGSLSTLARMSAMKSTSAPQQQIKKSTNTQQIKTQVSSPPRPGQGHSRHSDSDQELEASVPLMLNLKRKSPVSESAMNFRAEQVKAAARDIAKTELASANEAKKLVESAASVGSGREGGGENVTPLSIDSTSMEPKHTRRMRSNSLGTDFSGLSSRRPRAVSTCSTDTSSGTTTISASSTNSSEGSMTRPARNRASSGHALSSPVSVKTESMAMRISTCLEGASGENGKKLHAITPVSIVDQDSMNVVPSRKRLCSRGGDDMLIE